MPSFDCATCGASFSLSQQTVDRYPGWTPQRCRQCRGGRGGAGGGGGGGGTRRSRGATLVEENLTTAEVLARYTGGPTDGVFTDGSAHPNPGEGGWGAVYVADGQVVAERHGHEPHTTNNRMELTALIAGYELVPEGNPATVYTDSKLCVDTITKWAKGWAALGWQRKGGEIANLDLVQLLYARAQTRPELRLEWIAAHSGSRWNEYADSLSTAFRRKQL
ncbi:MAG: ribonuclease HI [Actinomycetota bacterium]|jgi:ribonuclease HI|nr:ribonuclease HI [Actinomycetota bacterium]